MVSDGSASFHVLIRGASLMSQLERIFIRRDWQRDEGPWGTGWWDDRAGGQAWTQGGQGHEGGHKPSERWIPLVQHLLTELCSMRESKALIRLAHLFPFLLSIRHVPVIYLNLIPISNLQGNSWKKNFSKSRNSAMSFKVEQFSLKKVLLTLILKYFRINAQGVKGSQFWDCIRL